MTTFLLFTLILLAFFSLVFRYARLAQWMLVVAVLEGLFVGGGWIPTCLLTSLQSNLEYNNVPIWKKSNAIVLLGVGTVKLPEIDSVTPTVLSYSRIFQTARLYFDCVKQHHCKVIVSGGDVMQTGISEAKAYAQSLISLGIKEENIILEANSKNTYQNAQFTSAIIKKNKNDQIVLVTSGMHMKRSLLYFSQFKLSPIPSPSDYWVAYIRLMPMSYNFVMADQALHEYIGIAQLYIYKFLGWNKKV